MTREEIVSKVNAVLAEEFEVEESVISPDADIRKTLELDSLRLVDLISAIQVAFGVKVTTEELHLLTKFSDLYDYIEKNL
ncbi:MAG: phosphopantetheine-binding protein [Bacteroidaceae bacterium]|nr:phosphopantetheine-binding protein [Bacteroidaceae bacterium]